MANFILSPNMNLPVPVIGVDPNPDWASNLNASLGLLDQHDHTPGNGTQITPYGLNINADLPMGGNNLANTRSVRLASQIAPLALAADLGSVYNVLGDLYYNDGLGNQVRITQSGGVAGSPGSISNLTSPASAAYVAASQTFVWQSAANTAANMDAASFILRNNTASSFGLTLSPPASMPANYTLTLPTLPASQMFMTLDGSGNMAAPWFVDNATLQVSSNLIGVIPGSIGTTQLATSVNNSITTLQNQMSVISRVQYQGSNNAAGTTLAGGTSLVYVNSATLFTMVRFTAGNAVVGTGFSGRLGFNADGSGTNFSGPNQNAGTSVLVPPGVSLYYTNLNAYSTPYSFNYYLFNSVVGP